MKRVKKLFSNRIFRSILTAFLPFCWFVLLDMGFRHFYAVPGCARWTNRNALLFSCCWAGIFSGLLFLLPRTPRRIVAIVLTVFFCVLLIVCAVIFNLTGTFFSFADLGFAGDGAKFFSFSYLRIRLGLLFLICGTLAVCIFTVCLMPKEPYRPYRWIAGLLVIALCVLGIFLQDRRLRNDDRISIAWDTATTSVGNDNATYAGFTDLNRCMHFCGCYQYFFRSALVSTGVEDRLLNSSTYEQLDAYYSDLEEHQDNAFSGVFAGKNLILVQLESIDTWMLTQEYMPNLYRLQQQGVDFSDFYTPLYSTAATFSTEFTANTGMVIPSSGISSRAYTDYAYPYSLPHLFTQAGYHTATFHPSVASIYNRGAIHANWGYEEYNDYTAMQMTDYMRDSEMIGGYGKMVGSEPFVSFIITYSGHGPYNETLDNISEGHWDAVDAAMEKFSPAASEADLAEYRRAIAHAMETDAFVGELIERMTQDGHLDDTVLFFYTDHYSKYMSNTSLVMELKGAENADMLTKTPCFFYCAGIKPQKVEKAACCLDILPTIANLFGLDTEYRYYAGKDLFSDGDGFVIFRNFDWYDGKTLHTAESEDPSAEALEKTRLARQILSNTWAALKCNYFARTASPSDGE